MEGENISTGNTSVGSKLKKGMLDTATAINESLQYIKAFYLLQVNRLVAKNEQELAEAVIQSDRIQVDATDAAEAEKKHHQQLLGSNC